MVIVHFKSGPSKLKIARVIKKTLCISIGSARDAVELGRIECNEDERKRVIKAIEDAGGKLT